MDRSARPLISVSALVLASFLAMNHIVQEAPLTDWGLVLLLLLIALFAWWLGRERPPQPSQTVHSASPVMTVTAAPPVPAPVPAAIPPMPVAPAPVEVKTAPVIRPATAAQPDDLKIIEGIGPKMAAALVAAGIDSFAKLAQSPESAIHAAIEAAGMRFAPSVPTWPEQAAYAARGDMDGLKAFQATLTGGRKAKK